MNIKKTITEELYLAIVISIGCIVFPIINPTHYRLIDSSYKSGNLLLLSLKALPSNFMFVYPFYLVLRLIYLAFKKLDKKKGLFNVNYGVPLRRREDGMYTFFPNGIFSKKGYILNIAEADRVKIFITTFSILAISINLIIIFVFQRYLLAVLIPLIILPYYNLCIRKFIKDKPQVKERLKPFEGLKDISNGMLLLMILGALCMVFFIILIINIIVKIDKELSLESLGFLLFCILLFALFSSIVFLKLRLEGLSRRRIR